MLRRSSNHRNALRETDVPPFTATSSNAQLEALRHAGRRNVASSCDAAKKNGRMQILFTSIVAVGLMLAQ
jgi:hypothetical protein